MIPIFHCSICFINFLLLQGKTTPSSNALVDVKTYEVKDMVRSDTHKTRDRYYKKNVQGYKEGYNEAYYYDIYIANPSKYPEIKDVLEEHIYHMNGFVIIGRMGNKMKAKRCLKSIKTRKTGK